MAGGTEPIDYFGGRGTRKVRIKSRFSLGARRRMYRIFESELRPGPADTVLDIGVTPDQTMADSNAFEQFYPYTDRITATSIEDASGLEKKFPGLTFVQTNSATLPFADREFDLAYSSAVLEHVGDRTAQETFVREVVRVSGAFFIAVPNRWFPLELHTMLPFLHWLPRRVHRAILTRLGKDFWAQEENLNLMGARELRSMFPAGVEVSIRRHRVLGMTSNLMAYGRRLPAVSGEGPG